MSKTTYTQQEQQQQRHDQQKHTEIIINTLYIFKINNMIMMKEKNHLKIGK